MVTVVSVMAVPAWKAALLEAKAKKAAEAAKSTEQVEDEKLKHLPAWKRELLLKKKKAAEVSHHVQVIASPLTGTRRYKTTVRSAAVLVV